MNKIILKSGREKSLRQHHPWVFSGAIQKVEGNPLAGETVDVLDQKGNFLGKGAWSAHSQIRVRIWSFREEAIDESFFQDRVRAAIRLRRKIFRNNGTTAFRLIASESDGLPGVIVDRYADFLVLQLLSAGAELWKDTIVKILQAEWPSKGIFERSDADVRSKEGLPYRSGLIEGQEPAETVAISENGLNYFVDIRKGHKTGFYLDQRDNRALIGSVCQDSDMLNCFSYTGGFGVAALAAGAGSVLNVDSAASVLELSKKNITLNNLPLGKAEHVEADVFSALRQFRAEDRRFDVIVLDPPKFVKSKAHLLKASRGYKDINHLAFSLLRPEGFLFTFSCSGLMPANLFQKIVADAALDAGKTVRIVKLLGQAQDHPIALKK